MNKALTAFLLVGILLCATACRVREPEKLVRGSMTGIGEYTREADPDDAVGDVTKLPVDDPRRIAAASKWDGNIQMVGSNNQIYTFSHGIGTKEEPYLLKNALDVARFAANVRFRGDPGNIYQDLTQYQGQYFRLECDIDMQGHPWLGIGGNGAAWEDMTMFSGIFDGAGHVIYNFALTDDPMNGFFSFIGRGAVIRNLAIVSGTVSVKSGETAGLLVAGARYGARVENCALRLNLTAGEGATLRVGAVGKSEDGTVTVEGCNFSYVKLNGQAYDLPDIAEIVKKGS